MQQRAVLWITGAFHTTPFWGIEAIAGLIPIWLYLDKLSSCHQLRMVTLPANHIIKSFFEHHLTSDLMPYYLSLNNVILKQRLKIKSSIVNTNNHLIGILPSFNSLYKKLSSSFCLVDTLQNCFSFNTIN